MIKKWNFIDLDEGEDDDVIHVDDLEKAREKAAGKPKQMLKGWNVISKAFVLWNEYFWQDDSITEYTDTGGGKKVSFLPHCYLKINKYENEGKN